VALNIAKNKAIYEHDEESLRQLKVCRRKLLSGHRLATRYGRVPAVAFEPSPAAHTKSPGRMGRGHLFVVPRSVTDWNQIVEELKGWAELGELCRGQF